MKIVIDFQESTPTPKMWAFAKAIAEELDVELPNYTFEETAMFLDNFKSLFYHKLSIDRAMDAGERVRSEYWPRFPVV